MPLKRMGSEGNGEDGRLGSVTYVTIEQSSSSESASSEGEGSSRELTDNLCVGQRTPHVHSGSTATRGGGESVSMD